jgi:hypothetical protein
MKRRNKTSVLGALGEAGSKHAPLGTRVPQDCGDVGLKIGRNGTWYYQNSPIGRKPLVEGSGQNQRLIFRTNVDDEVTAGGDHPLRFRPERDGGFTPFVLVRDGLEARLDRPVYYDLVEAAVTKRRGGKDELGVWSGGTFFLFPPSHDSGQD